MYVSRTINDQAQFIMDTDEGLSELLHTIFQDFARRIYQGQRLKPLETEVAQLASVFTFDQIQDGLEVLAAFMYMQPSRMYAPTPASVLRDYQLEIAQINRDLIRAITALNIFIVVDGENNIGFSTNIIRDSLVFQKLTAYLDSPEEAFAIWCSERFRVIERQTGDTNLIEDSSSQKGIHMFVMR